MKNEYAFIAVFEYADDGINISFPDLPGCLSCADVNNTEEAVKNAKENADINNIHNVSFMEGLAEDVIPRMYKEGVKADVVVVDPPRKGCDEKLINTLVSMCPDRIVYVSCNPATLARDLKVLCGNGFVVEKVQPVDMFPMSMHVETVVLLCKGE